MFMCLLVIVHLKVHLFEVHTVCPEGIHGVDQQGGLCHPSLRKAKCSKKPSQAILCGRLGSGVCEVDGVACCCFVHTDLVFV